MNKCENRHVCLKDLESYRRKDDYFADYSKLEKEEIKKNLGVLDKSDVLELYKNYQENYVIVTYDEIIELINQHSLASAHVYVISDFQSIYESSEGTAWGDSDHPSYVYKIVVEALTDTILDTNVRIISDDFENSYLWEVKYDVTSETINSVKTKGKITYLKDEYGNSAYYDFKSIQYRLTQNQLKQVGIDTSYEYKDFYTFNSTAKNISLDSNSYGNVFMKKCSDITIDKGCTGNIINTNIYNTHIYSGTCNTIIKDTIFEDTTFKDIRNSSIGPAISYIDKDTLTMQSYALDTIQ